MQVLDTHMYEMMAKWAATDTGLVVTPMVPVTSGDLSPETLVNSGHQLLFPPAKWCPIFASWTT